MSLSTNASYKKFSQMQKIIKLELESDTTSRTVVLIKTGCRKSYTALFRNSSSILEYS